MARADRLVLLVLASLLDPAITALAGWPPGALLIGVLAFIGVASLATAIHRTFAIARALDRDEPHRG